MTIMLDNWALFTIGAIILIGIVLAIRDFMAKPTDEQIANIRQWAIGVVTMIEIDLGSGTGKLKLAKAYDLFLQRFPLLADVVTFEMFSHIIDQALIEAKNIWANNNAVKKMIEGE